MSSQRRTGHRGAMDTRVQVGGADAAAKQAALQRLLVDRFAAKLGANSHEMRAIDSEVGAYLKLATVVDREGYEEIKGRVRAVLGVRGSGDRHRDDRGRGERARASTAMPSSRGRGARAGSTVSKASVDEWLLLRELDLLEREFVEKQRKEKELEATRQHFEEIDRQNDMIRTIKVDEEVAEVRFAEEAERRRREEGRLSRAVAAAKKADNAAFFESQKEQILERTLARTNARELRLAAEAGEVENIQQQIDLEKVYAAKRDKKVKRANRIVQRTNQKLVKEQEAVKEAERRAHKASAEVERIALEKQEMARRAALEKNYGKFKAQDLALELTQQLEEHHAEQRRRERELREDDERAAARLREEGRAIRAKAAADKAALEATWADIRRTTEEQKWQREADARAEAADGERHKRALQQQLALEKQAAERRRRDRLQFDEQYRAGLAVQIKAVRDKPDAGAMTDKERRLNAQRLKEIRSNPALKKVIKMRLRVPVES